MVENVKDENIWRTTSYKCNVCNKLFATADLTIASSEEEILILCKDCLNLKRLAGVITHEMNFNGQPPKDEDFGKGPHFLSCTVTNILGIPLTAQDRKRMKITKKSYWFRIVYNNGTTGKTFIKHLQITH